MDDELMRLFGGERMKRMMTRIGMEPGEPIYHPWLSRSIENAQKKVEERNFDIRKHLLEYDDVLNQQRKFIYEQRDAILGDEDLKTRVNDATAFMVGGFIEEFDRAERHDPQAAISSLADQLKSKFGYTLATPADGESVNSESLEKKILADLVKDMDDKDALIGTVYLNLLIRDAYLHYVDRRWLDHLENMEALREAVYLRHYAQKNPLTEYKVEGFQIFDRMIDDIRREIASRLHLIRIQTSNPGEGRPARSASTVSTSQSASHSSMAGSFGGSAQGGMGRGGSSPTANAANPQGAQVVRNQPKVGRNDPCPCGSGRKYKFCHGGQ